MSWDGEYSENVSATDVLCKNWNKLTSEGKAHDAATEESSVDMSCRSEVSRVGRGI